MIRVPDTASLLMSIGSFDRIRNGLKIDTPTIISSAAATTTGTAKRIWRTRRLWRIARA